MKGRVTIYHQESKGGIAHIVPSGASTSSTLSNTTSPTASRGSSSMDRPRASGTQDLKLPPEILEEMHRPVPPPKPNRYGEVSLVSGGSDTLNMEGNEIEIFSAEELNQVDFISDRHR
ncbi:hypothetical protein BT69DRAFT_302394 [Atractiella rhizophila]|nr:hypothetical protein BT69DRAFT_302394 [Atractiella rhizophila]